MKSRPNLQTRTLVVRLWREKSGLENMEHSVWRGSITLVPENELIYFQSIDDLFKKVAEYIDELEDGMPTEYDTEE